MENQILNAENSDKEYQNLKEQTGGNENSEIIIDFNLNRRRLLLHTNMLYISNTTEIELTDMNELHK